MEYRMDLYLFEYENSYLIKRRTFLYYSWIDTYVQSSF